MSNTDHALSFGAVADVYERSRPGYPDESIDWLIPDGAHRVLDLGAGTGKLTRSLVARGLDVVAVEPDAGMRAQLESVVPVVTAFSGSAESIPLDDASVDAVLVAQAWHWVDPERAAPEVARVLRPGGTFGLLWNVRDDTVPWLAAAWAPVGGEQERDFDYANPPIGDSFENVQHHAVRWTQRLSRDAMIELMASRSYVITRPDDRRAAVLAEVREVLDTHPDLEGRDELELQYTTISTRATTPLD
jgi:SAM-dependent methyltransferase